MDIEKESTAQIFVRNTQWTSKKLRRTVQVDYYLSQPVEELSAASLLLINDGQDLEKMNFDLILQQIQREQPLSPLVIAAIHCGPDRINEYGTAFRADYLGRGAKAEAYTRFVLEELLPAIAVELPAIDFVDKSIAGFSLGGLSAFDIFWNHPDIFSRAGVFSGSLWWRSVSQDDRQYLRSEHRLMHLQVRNGAYTPGLRFFFQCGEDDEINDRNKNGVIDSIDDTVDLMRELVRKGYREGHDLKYLQMADGKHDVASWSRALPTFLRWGWGV